jgi:putative membrane protein
VSATEAPVADTGWRRLSPLSPLVRLGRGGIAIVFILATGLLSGDSGSLWNFLVYAVLIPFGLVAGFVSWRVTRWRLDDGALQKEQGLFRRRSLRFPLAQIQAVDVLRPGLARALGLAELRLQMGGSTRDSARLAYLRTDDALALRRLLLARKSESAAQPVPVDRSATVLFRVSTARLLASLALNARGWLLIAAAVIAIVFVGPAVTAIWIIGGAAGLWRRLNADYGVRVSEVDDGLHLEGGLVATSAETIPRGRVQAVKLVEPILWRPFGWVRLQVDIAGGERDREGGASSTRSARTLVPVGTKQEADVLVAYLLPKLPDELRRAPSRARYKAPLSYRRLAWATNDDVVVTRQGRLARITAWVPLEKVQSLRRVRGPVQRLLRLETIHLDTAGRGVRAALRDRDVAEGEQALSRLVDLCRRARRETSIATHLT